MAPKGKFGNKIAWRDRISTSAQEERAPLLAHTITNRMPQWVQVLTKYFYKKFIGKNIHVRLFRLYLPLSSVGLFMDGWCLFFYLSSSCTFLFLSATVHTIPFFFFFFFVVMQLTSFKANSLHLSPPSFVLNFVFFISINLLATQFFLNFRFVKP